MPRYIIPICYPLPELVKTSSGELKPKLVSLDSAGILSGQKLIDYLTVIIDKLQKGELGTSQNNDYAFEVDIEFSGKLFRHTLLQYGATSEEADQEIKELCEQYKLINKTLIEDLKKKLQPNQKLKLLFWPESHLDEDFKAEKNKEFEEAYEIPKAVQVDGKNNLKAIEKLTVALNFKKYRAKLKDIDALNLLTPAKITSSREHLRNYLREEMIAAGCWDSSPKFNYDYCIYKQGLKKDNPALHFYFKNFVHNIKFQIVSLPSQKKAQQDSALLTPQNTDATAATGNDIPKGTGPVSSDTETKHKAKRGSDSSQASNNGSSKSSSSEGVAKVVQQFTQSGATGKIEVKPDGAMTVEISGYNKQQSQAELVAKSLDIAINNPSVEPKPKKDKNPPPSDAEYPPSSGCFSFCFKKRG